MIVEATIGFAKLSIDEERKKLFVFGKYNDRTIDMKQVELLVESLVENGVQWFNHENLLPLLVPTADYLEEASYTKDITLGPRLPELMLSGKGQTDYPNYIWASGQHRVQALFVYRQKLKDDIDRLMKQKDGEELISDEIPKIMAQIERLKEEINLTQYWGVAIYDESEIRNILTHLRLLTDRSARLLQDGQDACVQLSRNTELVHYGESDGERLRLYMNQIIKESDTSKHAKIREMSGQGNAKVRQLMKGNGSFLVLNCLTRFGQHFIGPSGLSATWLVDQLFGVSGGVSPTL